MVSVTKVIGMRDLEEFLKEQTEDQQFREEYKALLPRYAIIQQIIRKRIKNNLSQKELAKKRSNPK